MPRASYNAAMSSKPSRHVDYAYRLLRAGLAALGCWGAYGCCLLYTDASDDVLKVYLAHAGYLSIVVLGGPGLVGASSALRHALGHEPSSFTQPNDTGNAP